MALALDLDDMTRMTGSGLHMACRQAAAMMTKGAVYDFTDHANGAR